MTRDNDTSQPGRRRLSPLTLTAVAITAAAVGIAGALIFLTIPKAESASSGGSTGYSSGSSGSGSSSPGSGSSSSGSGSSSAGGVPSSGTQGGSGSGLPALPPLSGSGGGLQLMLSGKVLAISGTSITLGGNGPNVVARINGSTRVSGNVTSPSGIKVGDQVSAQVTGRNSSNLTAVAIQDPGGAP